MRDKLDEAMAKVRTGEADSVDVYSEDFITRKFSNRELGGKIRENTLKMYENIGTRYVIGYVNKHHKGPTLYVGPGGFVTDKWFEAHDYSYEQIANSKKHNALTAGMREHDLNVLEFNMSYEIKIIAIPDLGYKTMRLREVYKFLGEAYKETESKMESFERLKKILLPKFANTPDLRICNGRVYTEEGKLLNDRALRSYYVKEE